MFGRDKHNPELTREDTVDAQGATSARVKLDMSAGSLRLHGNATSLMDAHFEFNEGMEPRINYAIHDGRGELRVDQPGRPKSFNITRNRWDVRLSNELPLDLEIDNAAGEAEIDASALSLTSFELEQSAGRADVRLNGDQLRLNHVDLDVAAGKLDLEMRGVYPAMRDLRVDSSAGQVRLDLTGEWHSDVAIKVEVVAGEAVIRLPRTVNIVAMANTTIGRVRARGLVQDGDHYRLDVPGATGTLRLKVEANVGQVVLEVVK
ncbi:MAG: toast rack family protein [Chloroflexota bacterium]|nr:toast rack family protein [Chloroflexota bacterium]